ncbi:hypothetical protein ACIP72_36930, partial [Streptomyces cyaneofuscatus]
MPTTPDHPADQLRAAAALLRAAATAAAEHSGTTTWQSIRHFPDQPDSDFTTLTAGPGRPLHKGGGRGTPPYMHAPVSEYVALMGPGGGLALAALLEAVAVDAVRCRCVPECPTGAALAVARQLLGTSTGEAKRNEIRQSFAELAAQAREDRDHEGAADVELLLRDREEQWRREDAAAVETDEEREQREDQEATARDHVAGDHQHCGITCDVEMPTDHLRNFVVAKGYPGTVGALDELLRRAAAPPAPADRAAVLREAAEAVDNTEFPEEYVDLFDNGAHWASRLLRRLAGEAAAGAHHPTACTCDFIDEPWIKMRHADDCPAVPAAPE